MSIKGGSWSEAGAIAGIVIGAGAGVAGSVLLGESINNALDIANKIYRGLVDTGTVILTMGPATNIGGCLGLFAGMGAGYLIDSALKYTDETMEYCSKVYRNFKRKQN